ncbi:hypothetical protein FRB90_001207 [Tulasnella sp. 427]|nr:hypothetical protein FRB90_001207 [Tulasnella sp. 427]
MELSTSSNFLFTPAATQAGTQPDWSTASESGTASKSTDPKLTGDIFPEGGTGPIPSGKDDKIMRDPDFWVPESTPAVVFQADDVLFRVIPWCFQRTSAVLWDLCELGRKAEEMHQSEPTFCRNSETNPLVINDTSSAAFRALLKWMDPRHHTDGPLTPADYRLILPAAHRWAVSGAFKEAVEALHPSGFHMQHTERLWLAIMYDIPAWIRPTLKSLIRSIENPTEDDEARLRSVDIAAFRNLMATRNDIMQVRHKHLIRPPKVTHIGDCARSSKIQERCTSLWERMWRDSCLHLIATKEWLDPEITLGHLQGAIHANRARESMDCLDGAVQEVEDRGTLWKKERELEEAGMQAILGPYRELPEDPNTMTA